MLKIPNYILLAYLFIPFLVINLVINTDQQFVLLAHSFLKGNLDLDFAKSTTSDLSSYNGKYYFPLGPFPAILLLPFVFTFGVVFLQGIVQFPLNVLNFILVYKISRVLSVDKKKSALLAIFYIFGSVYTPVGAIPFSWYFAQVVATSLLLLAIWVFLTKKNYFLAGILLGFATLTRLSLIFSSVFFLIYIFKENKALLNLARLSIPIAVALIMVAGYNYARFNNYFDDGHKHQTIFEEFESVRTRGVLSIQHMPSNLYSMIAKPPDFTHDFPFVKFNNFGMSIFILSPVLFLIYKANFKNYLVRASALAILLTSLPILFYYSGGWRQIGFRYALDFFPFLLLIMAPVFKKTNIKVLIVLVSLGIISTWFFIFEKLSGA